MYKCGIIILRPLIRLQNMNYSVVVVTMDEEVMFWVLLMLVILYRGILE